MSDADQMQLTFEELTSRFSGIGDNCEFGLVQRCCGAEPLDLFRFAGAGLDNIIDVIATSGSHLFSPEDLEVYYVEEVDEYMFRSRHYQDFSTHTFVSSKTISMEGFHKKRVKIVSYLKRKFFEDMRRSEKIYVRKGGESIPEMRRLHAALNGHGGNALLHVAEADRHHRPGTIERIDDGIWRGFVARFKQFTKPEPIDLVSWLSILQKTYRSRHPKARFQKVRCLAQGQMRRIDPQVAVKANEIEKRSTTPLWLRLQRDTAPGQIVASVDIDLPVTSHAVVVLSVWIRLGESFRGSQVIAAFGDRPRLHSQAADLARRNDWQQVWTTFKMPARQRSGVLSIQAIAFQGSTLAVGGWTIEAGPIPWRRNGISSSDRSRHLALQLVSMRPRRTFLRLNGGDVWKRSARAMADGAFVEADDILAVAIANSPSDAALLKQYAFSAHNSGRYVVAIARWQKALAAAPHDPMCHAGVAANFREYGELGCAANIIETALTRFPEDATVLTEAVRIAARQGRFDEALALLEKAIRLFGPLTSLTAERDRIRAEIGSARSASRADDIKALAP